MTLETMIAEYQDALSMAGVADAHRTGRERVVGNINRAKTALARRIALANSPLLLARSTFSVAAADASITLPTDFMQLVLLTRTDTSQPVDCTIIDVRARERYAPSVELIPGYVLGGGDRPTLYMEGGKLYFAQSGGAPSSMTLRLVYRQLPADLAITATSSSFSDIPAELHPAIVDLALTYALPGNHPEYEKRMNMYSEAVDATLRALTQRVDDQPFNILNNVDAGW